MVADTVAMWRTTQVNCGSTPTLSLCTIETTTVGWETGESLSLDQKISLVIPHPQSSNQLALMEHCGQGQRIPVLGHVEAENHHGYIAH